VVTQTVERAATQGAKEQMPPKKQRPSPGQQAAAVNPPSAQVPMAGNDPTKYSVVIPAPTDAMVQRLVQKWGLSQSDVIRRLLAEGARRALGEEVAAGELRISLTETVGRALARAAEALNTSPQAVAGQLVAEHLPDVIRRARAVHAGIVDAAGGGVHTDGDGGGG
jgi:Arc/MetJ-type ribon-helix-helix transcriptional regulator